MVYGPNLSDVQHFYCRKLHVANAGFQLFWRLRGTSHSHELSCEKIQFHLRFANTLITQHGVKITRKMPFKLSFKIN